MANNTVIIGTGIIGVSTAYYLSESPRTPAQSIHLVEASPRLFASASGYAAGFLAADWYSPSVAPLGDLSFKLHKELAEKYNGREKWGYSSSTGTSLTSDNSPVGGGRDYDWLEEGHSRADAAGEHEFIQGDGPAWLTRRKGDSVEVISKDDTTAQVDPLRLSHFLLGRCKSRGVSLHQPAKVISVAKDMRGQLASVRIAEQNGEETDLPCTRVVIAAGAWSPKVFSTLFPASKTRLPISQLAGHSLVVRSPRWSREHEDLGCHAIFTTNSAGFSPEVFSRIGGEIYIAGLNSSTIPLPELATESRLDEKSIKQLRQVAKRMLGLSSGEDDLEIVRGGLCFRPVTNTGRPVICRIPDSRLGGFSTRPGSEGGAFLAAGHGPWGISQSLGTGKVMAELIEDLPTSANIKGLAF